MKLILFTIGCVLFMSGCETVSKSGPFVTNISSNGKGKLVIEKCMSKHGDLSGVSNDDCTVHEIKIIANEN